MKTYPPPPPKKKLKLKPLVCIKLRLSLTNSAIFGSDIEETVESGRGEKIKGKNISVKSLVAWK
jgi:hypothetical protein